MECPKCGKRGSKITNSRKIEMNVFRVRMCNNCGNKFYTEETEISIKEARYYYNYMTASQREYRERKENK